MITNNYCTRVGIRKLSASSYQDSFCLSRLSCVVNWTQQSFITKNPEAMGMFMITPVSGAVLDAIG